MTVNDFGRLLYKGLAAIIVAALVGAAISYYQDSQIVTIYRAKARITVSGEAAGIGALADSAASEKSGDGTTVSASIDTSSKTITVTAAARKGKKSVKAANAVIDEVQDKAAEVYPKVTSMVSEATKATEEKPDKKGHAIGAAVLGALLMIIALTIVDAIRRPVRNAQSASGFAHAVVLAKSSTKDSARRLVMNMSFLNNGAPRQICVIPIGDINVAKKVSAMCIEGFRGESDVEVVEVGVNPGSANNRKGVEGSSEDVNRGKTIKHAVQVYCCAPLSESLAGVCAASDSEITLLAIRLWRDRQAVLEETMRELQIASVQIDGIVIVA